MTDPGGVRPFDPLDLLAEASGILASSFDITQTQAQVAALCVRDIAEYCAILSATPGGSPTRRSVEAARDPSFRPLEAGSESGALAGRLKKAGFSTVFVLPLEGREQILGAFVLAARRADAFDRDAQKLAKILALQIVAGIEQSGLFERTQRVADRLQRALLPETLPRVPGVVFHGAYRPASGESEVGGDWYDAFALPDGRVAISLGDVAGHGLEAATIMGEIRQAMRSAAVGDSTPAGVLERINSVINLRASIGMVTAIFGYYDPAARELTYAVAGHPAPILSLGEGRTAFLPGGGLPLGVMSTVDATDCTVTLPPLAQVFFYTDGMTEYGRDPIEGERALLAAAGEISVQSAVDPAQSLQERIFAVASNRDDAATLTLSCENGPIPATLRYSAIPIVAPLVRATMRRVAAECGIPEERQFSLLIAIGEAIANAVEHAYRGEEPGPIVVRIDRNAEQLTVSIEDHGSWRRFQRRDERGRGINLMHELTDGAKITTTQNSTIVTLSMRLGAQASAAPELTG